MAHPRMNIPHIDKVPLRPHRSKMSSKFYEEQDIFEGSMEPELMCVGLSSGPLDRPDLAESKVLIKPSSIISRRKGIMQRGLVPLTIPIENTPDDTEMIPCSSSKTTDSGFVDAELSEISLESQRRTSGFRRQLDSTSSAEEEVFWENEAEPITATLPIAIPYAILNKQSYVHNSYGTPGSRGSCPYRAMDSPLHNMFSPRMAFTSGSRSISLAMYQCGATTQNTSSESTDQNPHGPALVTRRASESQLVLKPVPDRQRYSRLRSASGSSLPSPSRSIGTQTPTATGVFHFVFPDTFTTVDDNVNNWGITRNTNLAPNDLPDRSISSFHGIEDVGQQLRSIGDDYERTGYNYRRSQSLVELFKKGRRRSAP